VVTQKIYLHSLSEALKLSGPQDENFRRLEQKHRVQIFVRQTGQRGDIILTVRGNASQVNRTIQEIEYFRQHPDTRTNEPGPAATLSSQEAVVRTFHGQSIIPRTKNQQEYIRAMNDYDLVVAIGPAGTGKTFLAVAQAVAWLDTGLISRIILTRPVVEAGERLGFLPGDLYEKVQPYLKPLYDAFHFILGPEKFRFLREDETIEIIPLAYMRGRTLDDAFLILDEAQNTTTEQMKMFLTRFGQNSRVVITGDITQIDLTNKKESALVLLPEVLAGIAGVKFVYFSPEDVVRHVLVKKIIAAFHKWEKGR